MTQIIVPLNGKPANEIEQQGKEAIECPVCHSENSIVSKRVKIEVGDKDCTIAYIEFDFCNECGYREQVDWVD